MINIKNLKQWLELKIKQFEVIHTYEDTIVSVERIKDKKVFETGIYYSDKKFFIFIEEFHEDNIHVILICGKPIKEEEMFIEDFMNELNSEDGFTEIVKINDLEERCKKLKKH